MKKICCVNDMPGVGKIALSAMIPILSAKGVDVTCLPTSLVSNTLDFGKFDILDTSDYMDKTVDVWDELGFQFDCIATGLMVNPRQIGIVERLIRNQKKKDVLVLVDPIMGDEGKLYNGMDQSNVEIFRKLSRHADVMIPNFTEACFLADRFYKTESICCAQADELLDRCRKLGAKSVVITSACVEGKHCVIGYDHWENEKFSIEYVQLDVHFPGTGDIFSAVLLADMMNGESLQSSTRHAMETVSAIIEDNRDKEEKFSGVDIAKFIGEGKL